MWCKDPQVDTVDIPLRHSMALYHPAHSTTRSSDILAHRATWPDHISTYSTAMLLHCFCISSNAMALLLACLLYFLSSSMVNEQAENASVQGQKYAEV